MRSPTPLHAAALELGRRGVEIEEADAAELVAAYVARWPGLSERPELAALPLLVTLRGFHAGDARPHARGGALAAAALDPELEPLGRGPRLACLKEGVPAGELDALVEAYAAMGLEARVVHHAAVERASGRHGEGASHGAVAVARDRAALDAVVAAQRAYRSGDRSALLEVALLLGYPRCCVEAFAALPDAGDNLALERRPFLRAPAAALSTLLHRVGALRLAAHHPCSPDCAGSGALASAALDGLRARDERAAAWALGELGRPVLFLDHARRARLCGAWAGERFVVEELAPIGGVDWLGCDPARVVAITLRRDAVRLELATGGAEEIDAPAPLLTTPGAPLAGAARAAIAEEVGCAPGEE